MNHLNNNLEVSSDCQKYEKITYNNRENITESYNLVKKNSENRQNESSVKLSACGKQSKEDEDLIEQDLSDEEDNYEEPSVQRYMPGIYVDLKLKTKLLEKNGNKIAIPMIVDFYSECLKKYGDEKNFIYEESYLENMKVKDEELYPELYKFPKMTLDMNGEFQPQISLDNKQIINFPESQKQGPIEENLDDVIWLKNRPNDPLLRCIRSITDRLNIQGIVGDPTSYLKKGGDDMHYDMDDPFFDDSAMLSELKMSKSDILLQRAMEREFSDWSEDEEELDYTNVEPEDFVSEHYGEFEKEVKGKDVTEGEYKLFFEPSGWREYHSKIPKQFIPIYNEFENSVKKITEPVTDKLLRLKMKELLESIFKRLNKMQELSRMGVKRKPKKPKQSQKRVDKADLKEEAQEESEPKLQENERGSKEELESSVVKRKIVTDDSYNENFKRRGLNCILPYRVVDINGKILRWIVKSMTAMTNACSPYEIHCEWFSIVVSNNERVVSEYSNKLKSKLTAKLQAMKQKKLEVMLSLLSESTKSLSKSLGIIKKLLKEHRDLNLHKNTKSSQKDGSEKMQKKSLIEISLDSTREDHEDYMGLEPTNYNTELKEVEIPKVEYISTPHTPAFLMPNVSLQRSYYPIGSVDEVEEGKNEPLDTVDTNTTTEFETSSTQQSKILETFEKKEERGGANGKGEELVEGSQENQEGVDVKVNVEDEKVTVMEQMSQNTKTPKKTSATTKDEDLEMILKQSKIMNRVKDVHRVFKIAGSEVITFIQISNLAISVANKLQTKQFKHVVEHLGLTNNPFDQTYKRLSELMSKLLQELYEVKVNLVTDVLKVVVIKLQNQLKVEELYEKKSKKPLLLFDNSHTKATPGIVVLEQPKQKSTKKTVQKESSEGTKAAISENTGKMKEMKGSPKRKTALLNSLAKMQNTKLNDSRNQESVETVRKRRKTPTPSRVNSLKELLLSRLRN